MISLPRDLLAKAFPGMPRLWAAFADQATAVDDHGQRITGTETKLAVVDDTATQALDTAASAQAASALLDGITALNGDAGAIEITAVDQVVARPIDTADDASLLSKGRADTLYAGHVTQADSTATDVAGLKADLNTLLAALRA